MSNSQNNIKKNVMRRVYYTYVIQGLVNVRTLHLFAVAVLFFALNAVVSIGDVLYNLSLMKVYQVDTFLYSALTHTDWVTLLLIVGVIGLSVSLVRSMLRIKIPQVRRFGAA